MSVQIDHIKQSLYTVADVKSSAYITKDLDVCAFVQITPRDKGKIIQLTFSKEDWEDFKYQIENAFIQKALRD